LTAAAVSGSGRRGAGRRSGEGGTQRPPVLPDFAPGARGARAVGGIEAAFCLMSSMGARRARSEGRRERGRGPAGEGGVGAASGLRQGPAGRTPAAPVFLPGTGPRPSAPVGIFPIFA
jgi:hypothetical protein